MSCQFSPVSRSVVLLFLVDIGICQDSAWQSATMLPISCYSLSRRVKQSSIAYTLSQDALSQHGKIGCLNWYILDSAYSAAKGEHDQQVLAGDIACNHNYQELQNAVM